jgi:hypothetical protein
MEEVLMVWPAIRIRSVCLVWRGRFRLGVVVELPIIENLSPHTPVDQVADMLDELAIEIGRNGSPSFASVNADGDVFSERAAGLRAGSGDHNRGG